MTSFINMTPHAIVVKREVELSECCGSAISTEKGIHCLACGGYCEIIYRPEVMTFEPSGYVARVASWHGSPDDDGICDLTIGQVIGLPDPIAKCPICGTLNHFEASHCQQCSHSGLDKWYNIVSAMVLSVVKSYRNDCVAPATGHPLVCRNEKGQIVSVPCFVR